MSAGGSTRAVITALFANMGIAVAKFIGFALTRSSSMLAESIHSVADTSNQALLLLGGKRAKRAANDVHQFGYGRERYFWAFVVALLLFSVGAGFALYEGIEKIRHPHEIDRVGVAIGILIVAMLLEGMAFRTAFQETMRSKPKDQTLWGFIRKTRNPELPVVLLEDSAAMLGLLVALGGIGLAQTTGWDQWDGIATVIIGLILAGVAIILAVEMKSLLMGESAGRANTAKILQTFEDDTTVNELIEMRTQHVGPEEILVVARVRFDPALNSDELATEIDELQTAIHDAVPEATSIYIEPDLHAIATQFDGPAAEGGH